MSNLSIWNFFDYLFHIPTHYRQEQYWLESARQYRKEAKCAEDTLADVSAVNIELEQKNAALRSALRQIVAVAAGTLESYVSESKLYSAASSVFDADGDILFTEAEKMWGKFNYEAHVMDEWMGIYENASGADMFRHLLDDVKKLDGEGSELDAQMTQVYRNALVKMDLLDPVFYQEPVHKPVTLYCDELLTSDQIKALYERHQRKLDAAGFLLFHEAEAILGEFNESAFYFETNRGEFEVADGFKLLRYLLVQFDYLLGKQDFDRWEFTDTNQLCERCKDFSIAPTPEYAAFEDKLYRNTCLKLGLVHSKAELENEMEMRKQIEDASADLGYKFPSSLDAYTNDEIIAALRGETTVPTAA